MSVKSVSDLIERTEKARYEGMKDKLFQYVEKRILDLIDSSEEPVYRIKIEVKDIKEFLEKEGYRECLDIVLPRYLENLQESYQRKYYYVYLDDEELKIDWQKRYSRAGKTLEDRIDELESRLLDVYLEMEWN